MTIYLPAGLRDWLREEARRTHRTQAALMREALETYAAQRRPLPKSFGLGSDPELNGADVADWLRENWSAQ